MHLLMPAEGHVPGGSFQSTLCILFHQKYCIKSVCRNPEGKVLIKASEVLSETMQKNSLSFLPFLSSNTKSNLKKLNFSVFL